MRPSAVARLAILAAASLVLAGPPAAAGGGGTPQTKPQQKCIASFGAAAAGVARARALENQRCLAAFAKGKLADVGVETLRSCLARDPKGKVAKQVAKLDKVVAKSCTDPSEVPGFGLGASPSQAARVAATETTALFHDVLSENLYATARTCDDDAAGCKCQAAIEDGAADLASVALGEFGGCAKKILKTGAGSAAELAACAGDPSTPGSIAADSKGRLAKAAAKVEKTFAKRCDGAAAAVLPGKCVGRQGDLLGECIQETGTCRACLALNGIHGLRIDCDSLDDGSANRTCPAGAVSQETRTATSQARPAETPGTGGVVVENPKLIAQFGPMPDLNNAIYTQYKFANPPKPQPDAILVLVPGFEGGAGGFQLLAENLIPRAFVETGDVFEVWGFDRRTHQLEDLAGLDQAEAARDPLLALNWLFGAELGMPLDAIDLGRRAEFYGSLDVPFIANWTPLVHTLDIDRVIEAARSVARDGNVFLGGHSAGTGFTARYAATNLELDPLDPPSPGYEKLLGLVLIEGGGGSTAGTPPTEVVLDAIEARADGALFDAVATGALRCTDLVTPCTTATAETDCGALSNTTCAAIPAYAQFLGLSPQLLSSAESIALQATVDPDDGQAILQVDQGGIPGNNAVEQVPQLGILGGVLPEATAQGLVGRFVDDDGFLANLASFVAMSVGAEGPEVGGIATWLDIEESAQWPACPGDDCVTPDNGPQPTETGTGPWGVETEPIRFERLLYTFFQGGTNFTDWYYPSSGLSTTSGLPSLDSSALSLPEPLGRGRSDIENLTEAAEIDIPVIGLGGTNGLTQVPGNFTGFGNSIGVCTAPSCDGATARVVDAELPSEAFPTLGGVAGGYEVHLSIGYSHVDPLAAEDGDSNQVIGPLIGFLSRNTPAAP
jgi:pimeloyl-ACP methyl ester carboxylesterase